MPLDEFGVKRKVPIELRSALPKMCQNKSRNRNRQPLNERFLFLSVAGSARLVSLQSSSTSDAESGMLTQVMDESKVPWEDHLLERKTERDLKDIRRTAVAFANSVRLGHTAVILIGECDDGSVPGI